MAAKNNPRCSQTLCGARPPPPTSRNHDLLFPLPLRHFLGRYTRCRSLFYLCHRSNHHSRHQLKTLPPKLSDAHHLLHLERYTRPRLGSSDHSYANSSFGSESCLDRQRVAIHNLPSRVAFCCFRISIAALVLLCACCPFSLSTSLVSICEALDLSRASSVGTGARTWSCHRFPRSKSSTLALRKSAVFGAGVKAVVLIINGWTTS